MLSTDYTGKFTRFELKCTDGKRDVNTSYTYFDKAKDGDDIESSWTSGNTISQFLPGPTSGSICITSAVHKL